MLSKPEANSISKRASQPENAKLAICVTLPGITTLVTVLQFWNAPVPIAVTSLGITTSPPFPRYAISTPS